MEHREKHDIVHLEGRIRELSEQLTNVADDAGFQELVGIIHRPGWTTIAEATFVHGVVDAMREHVKVLAGLKQVLINGSRAVGSGEIQDELNPQPLPPKESDSSPA